MDINISKATGYDFNAIQPNFINSHGYSTRNNLSSQPAYILGVLLRESVDSIISNVSNAIGYVSENFPYSLNNLIAPYYNNNNFPPIIGVSGLTNNIISFNSKDADFTLLVQKLDIQYVSQNELKNDRLSVKVANMNTTFTNIFLKDVDQDLSPTALSNFSPINLTEVISLYAPTLLSQISTLKLKQIKNKDIFQFSSKAKSQETNGIDTLLIHETLFSYNPDNPDLAFSEAGTLFEKQLNADKNLSSEILDYFSAKLSEQYPFIQGEKSCKNLSLTTQNSISDIILSQTYSADPQATVALLNQALSTYSKFSYTSDIINALSASISGGDAYSAVPSDYSYAIEGALYSVHRTEPLRIVHCQNTEEMTQHSVDKETHAVNRRGFYSPELNVITFKGDISEMPNIFTPAFIHESSHAVINRLFKNDCQPFFKMDENQKALYEQAELAVFKNLAKKLNIVESGVYDFSTTQMAIKALKHSDILDRVINEEDDVMIKTHKVTEEDFLVLSELHSLIYHYGEDALSAELIVRIPQLLTQGVSAATLESYFKPLMDYWNTSITPEVAKIIEGKPSANSGYLLSF